MNINPGQSALLTCNPTIAGVPGGTLPMNPIVWTNNASNNGQMVTMTPDNNTCVIAIPMGCPGGSFTVTATCGSLTAGFILVVNAPALADGMNITGVIQ